MPPSSVSVVTGFDCTFFLRYVKTLSIGPVPSRPVPSLYRRFRASATQASDFPLLQSNALPAELIFQF